MAAGHGVAADATPLLVTEGSGANQAAGEVRSLLAVPVKIRGKVFGVLTAAAVKGGKGFTEKDLFYLSFTTQSAGSAIETLALL